MDNVTGLFSGNMSGGRGTLALKSMWEASQKHIGDSIIIISYSHACCDIEQPWILHIIYDFFYNEINFLKVLRTSATSMFPLEPTDRGM